MKKLFSMIVIVLAILTASLYSCTDEVVAPATNESGGGGCMDPKD